MAEHWQQSLRDWRVRQGLKLREWRRACLRGTLVILLLALLGGALVTLAPLPVAMTITLGRLAALMPLALTLNWLAVIPQI